MSRGFVVAGLLIALAAALTPPAGSQTVSGNIVGTVKDASGGVLQGAKVVVTNEGTNARYETAANERGEYAVPFLAVGRYSVRASAVGFQAMVRRGIVLRVDDTVRVDLSLPVGGVEQEITVTGAAPLLNTENASTGHVIENERVVNLPLNGRSFLSLAQLTADVNNGADGTYNKLANIAVAQNGLSFSAVGQRDNAQVFMLDGANVRSSYIGSITIVPSIDTIQEFKMQTAAYSAEYGTSPVQLNVATKSGTNSLHGSLYEFHRQAFLNARTSATIPKSPQHYHYFGGTVGGPIRKDRTFFFFGYEGRRILTKSDSRPTMPTELMRGGNFTELLPGTVIKDPYTGTPFSGNVIPTSRISPNTTPLLARYPLPNLPGLTQNYTGRNPADRNSDDYLGRVDESLTRNDKLYGRFALTNPRGLTAPPGAGGNPLQLARNRQRGQNLLVNETHTFNPRMFSEFRFAYNRSTYLIGPVDAIDYGPILKWGGVDHLLGVPLVQVNPYTLIRDQAAGGYAMRIYQATDNVFLYRGNHGLSAGFDFFRRMTDPTLPGGFSNLPPQVYAFFTGVYTGHPLADLLLGIPARGNLFDNRAGYISPPMSVRTPEYNLYVQDNWKASPKLTLNMGMRYELVPVLASKNGEMRNFDFATGKLYPDKPTGGEKFYQGAHKNFAPRFGFAYRLTDRTILRGGYGWFYSRTVDLGPTNLSNNPPANKSITALNTTPIPTITVNNFFNNFNPEVTSGGNVSAIAPDYTATPSTQSWSFDIQRQLAKDLVLEVGYKGNLSVHLDGAVDENSPPPGPGPINPRRPYPEWGGIILNASWFTSTYHGGLIKVEKRMGHGLSFLTSYSFAKTLDQTYGIAADQGEIGGTSVPQDRRNLRADKGRSGQDLRHRAVFSYLYELPVGPGKPILGGRTGWLARLLEGYTMSGIMTLRSGLPVTVRTDSDPTNTGNGIQRVDVLFNPNLPADQRNGQRWFATEAFAKPPITRYGNAGRSLIDSAGVYNFDVALMKNTRIRERIQLQLRFEGYNAFNHLNLGTPGFNFGTSTFGRISTSGSRRVHQIAAKVLF